MTDKLVVFSKDKHKNILDLAAEAMTLVEEHNEGVVEIMISADQEDKIGSEIRFQEMKNSHNDNNPYLTPSSLEWDPEKRPLGWDSDRQTTTLWNAPIKWSRMIGKDIIIARGEKSDLSTDLEDKIVEVLNSQFKDF